MKLSKSEVKSIWYLVSIYLTVVQSFRLNVDSYIQGHKVHQLQMFYVELYQQVSKLELAHNIFSKDLDKELIW